MRTRVLRPHVNHHAAQTTRGVLHSLWRFYLGDCGAWERVWGRLLPTSNLFLHLHNAINQRFRARWTSSDVDVDRANLIDPLQHAIGAIHPTRRGTRAHREDPLGIGHLIVDLAHRWSHLT